MFNFFENWKYLNEFISRALTVLSSFVREFWVWWYMIIRLRYDH